MVLLFNSARHGDAHLSGRGWVSGEGPFPSMQSRNKEQMLGPDAKNKAARPEQPLISQESCLEVSWGAKGRVKNISNNSAGAPWTCTMETTWKDSTALLIVKVNTTKALSSL